MTETARIIKELREDNDLTQKEIAAVIGTTQQHYSKYENGEHDLPLRIALLLAEYYNISMDFLTGRTKAKHKMDTLTKDFIAGYTTGELMGDIMSLSNENKVQLKEYVEFLRAKNTLQ